jgi:putative methionine-R-sulfoxide reductase with GAF domain
VTAIDLIEDVRRESRGDGTPEERAGRIAVLIRERTGRRWVGIYRVTDTEVRNLAWSGPALPAYPNFAIGRGLTGAAVASGSTMISNDVRKDSGTVQAFGNQDQMLFEGLAAALLSLYT